MCIPTAAAIRSGRTSSVAAHGTQGDSVAVGTVVQPRQQHCPQVR